MKKWLSLFTVMMILLMLLPVSMADSPSYTITYVLNDGYNDRDNPTSYRAVDFGDGSLTRTWRRVSPQYQGRET